MSLGIKNISRLCACLLYLEIPQIRGKNIATSGAMIMMDDDGADDDTEATRRQRSRCAVVGSGKRRQCRSSRVERGKTFGWVDFPSFAVRCRIWRYMYLESLLRGKHG